MMCKYFGCSIIIVVENLIDVSVVTEINYQLGYPSTIIMFTRNLISLQDLSCCQLNPEEERQTLQQRKEGNEASTS